MRKLVFGLIVLIVILLLAATAGFFWFNRFPIITLDPTLDPKYVISPAYGTVLAINETENTTEIIIYLSALDIHFQFYPTDGKVLDTHYDSTGKFEIANDANKSNMNEKQITRIKTDFGPITIKQIAGKYVRRIQFYNKPCDEIKRGDPMGRIKFGSRVDIILPKPILLKIKKGDYLNGPNTVIAEFSAAQ